MFHMTVNIAGDSEQEVLDTLDNLARAIVHKDTRALAVLEGGAKATYEMARDFNRPRTGDSRVQSGSTGPRKRK